jgi:hypothetical protein
VIATARVWREAYGTETGHRAVTDWAEPWIVR